MDAPSSPPPAAVPNPTTPARGTIKKAVRASQPSREAEVAMVLGLEYVDSVLKSRPAEPEERQAQFQDNDQYIRKSIQDWLEGGKNGVTTAAAARRILYGKAKKGISQKLIDALTAKLRAWAQEHGVATPNSLKQQQAAQEDADGPPQPPPAPAAAPATATSPPPAAGAAAGSGADDDAEDRDFFDNLAVELDAAEQQQQQQAVAPPPQAAGAAQDADAEYDGFARQAMQSSQDDPFAMLPTSPNYPDALAAPLAAGRRNANRALRFEEMADAMDVDAAAAATPAPPVPPPAPPLPVTEAAALPPVPPPAPPSADEASAPPPQSDAGARRRTPARASAVRARQVAAAVAAGAPPTPGRRSNASSSRTSSSSSSSRGGRQQQAAATDSTAEQPAADGGFAIEAEAAPWVLRELRETYPALEQALERLAVVEAENAALKSARAQHGLYALAHNPTTAPAEEVAKMDCNARLRAALLTIQAQTAIALGAQDEALKAAVTSRAAQEEGAERECAICTEAMHSKERWIVSCAQGHMLCTSCAGRLDRHLEVRHAQFNPAVHISAQLHSCPSCWQTSHAGVVLQDNDCYTLTKCK